ncbi:helix-turn-helix domain-containing protein [Clostridium tertium]
MDIKEIRKNKGLKQSFVASELGITRQWFAKLERGEKPLSKLQKEKLSQIYNVSLENFNK